MLLPAAAILFTPALGRAEPKGQDPWFGPDKALHFTASAIIAGGGYGLGALAWQSPAERAALGAGLGLAAGAGKEVFDLAGFGDPSWKDFTWDVLGVAVGIGLSIAIDFAARSPTPAGAR